MKEIYMEIMRYSSYEKENDLYNFLEKKQC